METNLWGTIYGCHSFIPRMKEQGGGHIVNIASVAGVVSTPETAPYNVSKAGVISLTETLRSELAPFDIGVTAVCPIFFDSHLFSTMTSMQDVILTDISLASAENTRTTADDIAAKVVKAVEKNRLYVFPQLSSKAFWLYKRITPSIFFAATSFLYKHKLMGPILVRLARRGML